MKYINNFLIKYTSLRKKMILNDKKKVISNSDLFKIIFCPCLKYLSYQFKLKEKIFKIASDKINMFTDISVLIKKIIEIDALKYLLLDEDQRYIFKFIAKPDISLYNSKFSGYFNSENFDSENHNFDLYDLKRIEIENFKTRYLRILQKSNKLSDGIDNRLINSLNPLISHVIENSKNFEI